MLSQKIPWYYSLPVIILSTLLAVVLIYAWQEPTAPPPGGNVPAPINVGDAAQIKTGPLQVNGFKNVGSTVLEGYLRLPCLTTAQRDALSPEKGMIIFNKDADRIEFYSEGEWKTPTVISAKKRIGESCTSSEECESGYCVDGVCCNTACNDKVCQRCDSYSVNGVGYCGYVYLSTEDPDNECDTSGCGTGNCKGDTYACGYYTSGKHDCGTCTYCDGATSTSCVNISNGLDPYNECGGSSCCGYCSGSGTCVYRPAGSTCSSPGSSCGGDCHYCNGSGGCGDYWSWFQIHCTPCTGVNLCDAVVGLTESKCATLCQDRGAEYGDINWKHYKEGDVQDTCEMDGYTWLSIFGSGQGPNTAITCGCKKCTPP